MLDISTAAFWIAVLQIIAIDIMLGGDNAVVIALACRKLPDAQRKQGIFWGVVGAIILRIILIFFALQLLAIPWLKIVGALLLFWIGIKLLQPENEDHGDVAALHHLATALLGFSGVVGVLIATPVDACLGLAFDGQNQQHQRDHQQGFHGGSSHQCNAGMAEEYRPIRCNPQIGAGCP